MKGNNKMKKLLIILLFIPLIFACSSDDSAQNSSSGFNYWFKIIIGNETFEIEGNINDYDTTTDNLCLVGVNSTDWFSILSINDPTESNYINGGNVRLVLSFQPTIGQTSAKVYLNQAFNPYLNTYFIDNGVVTEFGTGGRYFDDDFYSDSYIDTQTPSDKNTIELEILNLGVPYEITSTGIIGGEMFSGSYIGTWYFKDSNYQYSIPFNVSIEFNAYRIQ